MSCLSNSFDLGFIDFAFLSNEKRPPVYEEVRCYLPRCVLFVIMEILISYLIVSFYYHNALCITNILSILPFIVILLSVLVILVNAADSLRVLLLYELRNYYEIEIFENKNPSLYNKNQYAFLVKRGAMIRHRKFTKNDCPICQMPLKETESKSILQCGHLYHTQCLNEYEAFNNINHNNHFGKCSLCREDYHYKLGKFAFNENYFDEIPMIYRPLPLYYDRVGDVFDDYVWDKFVIPQKPKQESNDNTPCIVYN